MQRAALFRGEFDETFGFENSRLANCAQLPPFGGHRR
jgi:hypothetical protein